MNTLRISVDGNIGCGKSTYLDRLFKEGYLVFPKINNNERYTWINKYRHNMVRWCFGCHVHMLLEQCRRYNQLKHIKQSPLNNVALFEQSPYTIQHIFNDLLYQEKIIDNDEYKLLNNLIEEVGWRPDAIIYLYCDPQICYQRLTQATQLIDLNYLQHLHKQHEIVFDEPQRSLPIYKINANQAIDQVVTDIKYAIAHLTNHDRTIN